MMTDVFPARRRREVTRLLEASQPMAGGWICKKPSSHEKRIQLDAFRYELQRRAGLNVTGAPAEVGTMLRCDGVPCDAPPWGLLHHHQG